MLIAVLLAVLAAVSNAFSSVLQRRAARELPRGGAFRLALLLDLLQTPVWLAGLGALISGFLLQAAALDFGEITLVQPVLVIELPFTMVAAALVFRRSVGRRAWVGSAAVSAGLAIALVAASPGGGRPSVPLLNWLAATGATVALVAALVSAARVAVNDSLRAALLGASSGVGFGFTAALIKGATNELDRGVGVLFTSWQTYALVVSGISSVVLLQSALHSGTLVAAQPAITTCDPLVSVGFGVIPFAERLQFGPWLVPEIAGLALVVVGSIELARSPLVHGRAAPDG